MLLILKIIYAKLIDFTQDILDFSLCATFCCRYLQDGGRTNPLDAFNSGIEHIYMPVEPSCLRLGLRGGKGLWLR